MTTSDTGPGNPPASTSPPPREERPSGADRQPAEQSDQNGETGPKVDVTPESGEDEPADDRPLPS